MAQLIHQFAEPVVSASGASYVAQAWAEFEGRWHGWLVFIAADGGILRTTRETTQASRDAMAVWAKGLRPVYLDGALSRAVAPSAELPAA